MYIADTSNSSIIVQLQNTVRTHHALVEYVLYQYIATPIDVSQCSEKKCRNYIHALHPIAVAVLLG